MSILKNGERSKFCEELSKDLKKKYFDLKDRKYINQIDTLYYTVYIENDNIDNKQSINLIEDIYKIKSDLYKTGIESSDFILGLKISKERISDYDYKLSMENSYDIFVSKYIRNHNTPRILVQIRSKYIWENGIENALYSSFEKVKELLKHYDLNVYKVIENRIDYIWQSNCIQSPEKFFDAKSVSKTYKGNFNIGQNVFNFSKNEYSIDYLGLGSRKSNNVYFRIYDKTREVIENKSNINYFDLWYKEGLINFYDKYCLEYAYKKGIYDKIYEGSLRFYLEYGTKKEIKDKINTLFEVKNTKLQDIKSLSKDIMPSVTKVLNFEFETKRKYYYNRKVIDELTCNSNVKELDRLLKIIENRKIFMEELTTKIVSFEKNGKIMDFWKRLKQNKIKESI